MPLAREYTTYLFDVGGTLITFDERRRAAKYAEQARTLGLAVTPDAAFEALQRLNDELPERTRGITLSLLPEQEQRAFWLDWWAEGFRQLGIGEPEASRLANELLDPVNGGNFQQVFQDTKPALDALAARGKRLGIISNFSRNCESLLTELGLAHYFDFFIVSAVVGVEKPDPRIFQEAVRAAAQPLSDLVYVGDSVFHDVQGARAAGMDAVLVDRSDRFPQFQGARVRNLREL